MRLAALLVAWLLGAPASMADSRKPPNAVALRRARAHFESGAGFFRLGHFREALEQYAAAYQIDQRPELIVDMAMAHEKLGDKKEARELYARFLTQASPDDPLRPEIQRKVLALDAVIAAEPPPAVPPSSPTPVVAASTTAVAGPSAEELAAAHRHHVRRTLAWSLPVGIIVLGGALAVGLYFGLRPVTPTTCQATLGCVQPPPAP